ncbi:MAG: YncE family protein, partial [Solirubrobacterales bacterium]|nr:YncE family protein [Solirubrobacterales bacterium]
MPVRRSSPLRSALAALALALVADEARASNPVPDPIPGQTRPAILIGNNWAGTTDIVDPVTYERLGRVNIIPDFAERKAEIMFDPVRQGFFIGVRELIGEGNDQLVDDAFASNDGRFLYASRPSLADVVSIELATGKIVWRARVDGYRSDHMAVSEDGTRLLVSASTGNVVHELDTATGKRVGGFPSGDSPHESLYSKDGTKVYHASIGRVYLPVDRGPADARALTRGGEFFQIIDAKTNAILERVNMSEKLAEAGFPDMSAAVRPMTLSPDEKFVYFQVSFFHGFVEYDLEQKKVTRVANLPISAEAAATPIENYVLDSAHHGLVMSKDGSKLCAAGTSSDYAAIVDRKTFAFKIVDAGRKPYWSTDSVDGKYCYMSMSADDVVSVIDFETGEVVKKIPVGRHPQRVRNGVVRVKDFPQGAHGESFRLRMFTEKGPISVKGGDENVGCRAKDAKDLRLASCTVEVKAVTRRGAQPRVIGRGARTVGDRRSFK